MLDRTSYPKPKEFDEKDATTHDCLHCYLRFRGPLGIIYIKFVLFYLLRNTHASKNG